MNLIYCGWQQGKSTSKRSPAQTNVFFFIMNNTQFFCGNSWAKVFYWVILRKELKRNMMLHITKTIPNCVSHCLRYILSIRILWYLSATLCLYFPDNDTANPTRRKKSRVCDQVGFHAMMITSSFMRKASTLYGWLVLSEYLKCICALPINADTWKEHEVSSRNPRKHSRKKRRRIINSD